MTDHLSQDYNIKSCTWKPTSGKLYQCLDPNGFFIYDRPISTYEARGLNPYNVKYSTNYLKYGTVFMYLGGSGSRQVCPNHYTAFRILIGDQIKWLIYPERFRHHERYPIDPIRL